LLILLGLAVVTVGLKETRASGEIPEDRGAAGVYQSLKRLQTGARVLYVVAHPDDEDAGTLCLLSRGYGASVTLLSLTRGEAGANLITGDFFDRLGALRTLEHVRAAGNYGVELRYTRFADFGFSKSVEETWRNWDREAVLEDVVRVIREVQPHVVIARFQGTARDGHGHHIASGLLAQDAFRAASDPARFPGAGKAWQAAKLYTGNWRAGEPGVLAVDSGQYDPILGRSYAEIGREGYRFQRSQAMGAVLMRPGPSIAYYRRADSPGGNEQSFFDGLEKQIAPPQELASFSQKARAAWPNGDVALVLAEGLRAAQKLGDPVWIEKFNSSLIKLLGVELEVLVEPEKPVEGMAALFRPATTFRLASPGVPFRVRSRLHVRSSQPVKLGGLRFEAQPDARHRQIESGLYEHVLNGAPTAAHWRRSSIRETRYEYTSPAQWGRALPAVPLVYVQEFEFQGAKGEVRAVPLTRQIDPIGLEVREPLALGPGLSVRFTESALVMPSTRRDQPLEVIVRNEGGQPADAKVRLDIPAGWEVEPAAQSIRLEREGEEQRLRFVLRPTQREAAGRVLIGAVVDSHAGTVRHGFERITYGGLGAVYLASPAQIVLERADVTLAPGLRVGYVMGSGDEVPLALRQLGAEVDLLDAGTIAGADLARYHTILLGIRAYAARPELAVHNRRLLHYVEQGGVLIVQYNTQEYDRNFGPAPYTMTARAEETSEEDAPVTVLAPQDPVFSWPNRITAQDWDGWFEQRGSKFFTTWDASWQPMVETHDTGQAPQRGVWLQARHGKGLYVYCALAWYRQLPMAVPGAARIFANLVSQGAPGAPWRQAR
jgi:LmbE family N-acetylglucosaminyl deacetylase